MHRFTRTLALLGGALAASLFIPAPSAAASCGTVPMALHRGASEYRPQVENTYGADVASWRAGATYVGNDVRFTRTGVPMMLHDPTLDRTTNGSGRISRMSARQVRRFRTTDGQRVPFTGTIVRTAARMGYRGVVLEVKNYLTAREADRLTGIVERAGMTHHVVFTVWNDHNARYLERRLPGALTARYDPKRSLRNVGHADLYILSQHSLTRTNVERLRAMHKGAMAPTIWVPGATTLGDAYGGLNYVGVTLALTSETRWVGQWKAAGCPSGWMP